MNWFRLYAEARNDAKLRSLTDAQHRVWFNLLCFASEQSERGVIAEYDLDLLALEVASGDLDLLTGTLDRLARLRIVAVTPNAINFIHWLERQYDKPSDRPDRVKIRVEKHRAAPSNAPEPPPPNGETRDMALVTPSNADETPSNAYTQNREYAEQIRSDDSERDAGVRAHEDAQRERFDTDLPSARRDHPVNAAPKPSRDEATVAAYQAVYAAYPRKNGIDPNYDTGLAEYIGVPLDIRPRVLIGVEHYAQSDEVSRGLVMALARFIRERHYEQWQRPETPPAKPQGGSGHGNNGYHASTDAARLRVIAERRAARSAGNHPAESSRLRLASSA